jgi:ABC-2 type transport system ATP-binding protein
MVQHTCCASNKLKNGKDVDREVDRWLARMDLTEWAGRSSKTARMSRRCSSSRSVVHRPDLVILDEPFTGLDPVNQGCLQAAVLDLHEGRNRHLQHHDMSTAGAATSSA